MMLYTILLTILIGIIVGTITGLIGSGSHVLIVPLLLIFGLSSNINSAIGISLLSVLAPINIFAIYQYYKKDYIKMNEIIISICIGLLICIFSYISSKYLNDKFDSKKIKKIYAVFLIFVSIIIFSL